MQINTNPYTKVSINQSEDSNKNSLNKTKNNEPSLEEEINKSSVEVSLSMGAQLILFMME